MYTTEAEDGVSILLGRIMLAGICGLVSVGLVALLTHIRWGLLVVLFLVITLVVLVVLALFGDQTRKPDSDEFEEYAHEGLTD